MDALSHEKYIFNLIKKELSVQIKIKVFNVTYMRSKFVLNLFVYHSKMRSRFRAGFKANDLLPKAKYLKRFPL